MHKVFSLLYIAEFGCNNTVKCIVNDGVLKKNINLNKKQLSTI